MKNHIFIVALLAVIAVFRLDAGPRVLAYQGQLYKNGTPVNGSQVFHFYMLTNSVTAWDCAADITLTVENGFFSVNLGDQALMAALPTRLLSAGEDVYLRVSVGDTAFTMVTLTPDKRIAAAAYTISADTINGVPINQQSGVQLAAADRPMITRAAHPFTYGSYTNSGRWGLFLESLCLTFGIPYEIGDAAFQFAGYNISSQVASVYMTILNTGRVGIGTTEPLYGLHLKNGGWNDSRIVAGCPYDSTAGFGIEFDGHIAWDISNGNTSTNLYISSPLSSPVAVSVMPNGNVGVKLQFPECDLHVKSVLKLDPRYSVPGSATEGMMYYDANDKMLYVYDGSVWHACW